jgi:hypothetical protein
VLQHPIGKRRLPVVNVSDDRKIANVILHVHSSVA